MLHGVALVRKDVWEERIVCIIWGDIGTSSQRALVASYC
jgi:hypothetical protein